MDTSSKVNCFTPSRGVTEGLCACKDFQSLEYGADGMGDMEAGEISREPLHSDKVVTFSQ